MGADEHHRHPRPPTVTKAPAPPAVDRSAAQALTHVFTSAGYRGEAVRNLLAVKTILLLDAASLPLARRHVAAHDTALAALVWLFLLGQPLEDPERRLGDGAEMLVAAGLAREERRKAPPARDRRASRRPADRVGRPARDDRGGLHPRGGPRVRHPRVAHDPPAGRAGARFGTGNGIQAVLAAKHARTVVATDISERALAFAEFNCALNGIENVELRQGSFLEPVTGERFGLVVSNPPLCDLARSRAPLPRQRPRPRPRQREASSRRFRGPRAGRVRIVTASWIVADEHTDDARPRRGSSARAATAGCSTRSRSMPSRARSAGPAAGTTPSSTAGSEYFERERILRIGYGMLVLRPSHGEGWTRARLQPESLGAGGAQLERVFAGVERRYRRASGRTARPSRPTSRSSRSSAAAPAAGTSSARALRLTGGLPFFETTVDETGRS